MIKLELSEKEVKLLGYILSNTNIDKLLIEKVYLIPDDEAIIRNLLPRINDVLGPKDV